jgi:hypothetical protein
MNFGLEIIQNVLETRLQHKFYLFLQQNSEVLNAAARMFIFER